MEGGIGGHFRGRNTGRNGASQGELRDAARASLSASRARIADGGKTPGRLLCFGASDDAGGAHSGAAGLLGEAARTRPDLKTPPLTQKRGLTQRQGERGKLRNNPQNEFSIRAPRSPDLRVRGLFLGALSGPREAVGVRHALAAFCASLEPYSLPFPPFESRSRLILRLSSPRCWTSAAQYRKTLARRFPRNGTAFFHT